eukprot:5286925-Amphidinium_carterae.1
MPLISVDIVVDIVVKVLILVKANRGGPTASSESSTDGEGGFARSLCVALLISKKWFNMCDVEKRSPSCTLTG